MQLFNPARKNFSVIHALYFPLRIVLLHPYVPLAAVLVSICAATSCMALPQLFEQFMEMPLDNPNWGLAADVFSQSGLVLILALIFFLLAAVPVKLSCTKRRLLSFDAIEEFIKNFRELLAIGMFLLVRFSLLGLVVLGVVVYAVCFSSAVPQTVVSILLTLFLVSLCLFIAFTHILRFITVPFISLNSHFSPVQAYGSSKYLVEEKALELLTIILFACFILLSVGGALYKFESSFTSIQAVALTAFVLWYMCGALDVYCLHVMEQMTVGHIESLRHLLISQDARLQESPEPKNRASILAYEKERQTVSLTAEQVNFLRSRAREEKRAMAQEKAKLSGAGGRVAHGSTIRRA